MWEFGAILSFVGSFKPIFQLPKCYAEAVSTDSPIFYCFAYQELENAILYPLDHPLINALFWGLLYNDSNKRMTLAKCKETE